MRDSCRSSIALPFGCACTSAARAKRSRAAPARAPRSSRAGGADCSTSAFACITRGGELTIAWPGDGCAGDDEGPGAHGIRRRMAIRGSGRGGWTRRPRLTTRRRSRMDASAVADYLKKNPAFFEDYADVVAQIFVPHPHGGHAIPIAERQMLALRDKRVRSRAEAARADPPRHRKRRDRRKAASLDARAVRRTRSRDDARRAVAQPQGRFRRAAGRDAAVAGRCRAIVRCPNSPRRRREMREYADRLARAVLRTRAPRSNRANGSTPSGALQSFAYLPLRTEQTFGMLALAATTRIASTPAWAPSTCCGSPSSRASRSRASCPRRSRWR